MAFIPHGPPLSRQLETQVVTRQHTLQRFKKLRERVLRELLGCCSLGLQLSEDLLDFWDQTTLWRIMTACVIMHNMIIEDERGQPEDFVYDHVGTPVEPKQDEDRIYNFLEMHRKIEDPVAHSQLRDDLVEHLWQIHGQ